MIPAWHWPGQTRLQVQPFWAVPRLSAMAATRGTADGTARGLGGRPRPAPKPWGSAG